MDPHQINESGICSTCNEAVSDEHVLDCYICKGKFHGKCNEVAPFACNSFVKNFKSLKGNVYFFFVCDHCKTDRENTEVSTLKEQMFALKKSRNSKPRNARKVHHHRHLQMHLHPHPNQKLIKQNRRGVIRNGLKN